MKYQKNKGFILADSLLGLLFISLSITLFCTNQSYLNMKRVESYAKQNYYEITAQKSKQNLFDVRENKGVAVSEISAGNVTVKIKR